MGLRFRRVVLSRPHFGSFDGASNLGQRQHVSRVIGLSLLARFPQHLRHFGEAPLFTAKAAHHFYAVEKQPSAPINREGGAKYRPQTRWPLDILFSRADC